MGRGLALALLAIANAAAPSAQAQQAPAFQLQRTEEDYSYLVDPQRRQGFDDELKYIGLGATSYLSLGGELRERGETYHAPLYGIGREDNTYDVQRVLLHADYHGGDWLRVFVQLGEHATYGKHLPLSAADSDQQDVQNAFVELTPTGSAGLRLRAGRQEFAPSPTQRFLSVREGPNIRQSFDGLVAGYRATRWSLDALALQPVQIRPGAWDDRADPGQHLGGLYGRWASPEQHGGVDLYWLSLTRHNAVFGAVHALERRQSLGLRTWMREGAWDLEDEFIYQYGAFGAHSIGAWAGSIDLGWTLERPWRPRLGIRADVGSGGDTHVPGRVATFNPMFPKAGYFDETTLTSWANLMQLRPSVTVQPASRLTVQASLAQRWRENARDAVYLHPYIALAPTLVSLQRDVSTNVMLDATWRASRYLTLWAQAVHVIAGPAITRAGGHDVNYGMLSLQLKF